MSGTSYEDAVKGTEFDALDKETALEFEESVRRLTALRENRLEEYLESKGYVPAMGVGIESTCFNNLF